MRSAGSFISGHRAGNSGSSRASLQPDPARLLQIHALLPERRCSFRIEAIILPLGVSFFTFQQIMFLTTIYKAGHSGHGLKYYAASVSFFPHLIAGPIVPYRELMPQFARTADKAVPWDQIAPGMMLFALGL